MSSNQMLSTDSTAIPQPKKSLCAYTCKSSVGCRDVTSGTCPFAGHVCCRDAPTHPFPNPFPSKVIQISCHSFSRFTRLNASSFSENDLTQIERLGCPVLYLHRERKKILLSQRLELTQDRTLFKAVTS